MNQIIKRIFSVIALLSFLGISPKANAKLDKRFSIKGRYVGHLFGRIRPVNGITMVYRGVNYYVHQGKYYRFINGEWVTVKPNFSIKQRFIPDDAREITRGSTTFYAHRGTYYRPVLGGYVRVDL